MILLAGHLHTLSFHSTFTGSVALVCVPHSPPSLREVFLFFHVQPVPVVDPHCHVAEKFVKPSVLLSVWRRSLPVLLVVSYDHVALSVVKLFLVCCCCSVGKDSRPSNHDNPRKKKESVLNGSLFALS